MNTALEQDSEVLDFTNFGSARISLMFYLDVLEEILCYGKRARLDLVSLNLSRSMNTSLGVSRQLTSIFDIENELHE